MSIIVVLGQMLCLGVKLIFGFEMTLLSENLAKLLQLPVSSAMIDIWQISVSYAVGRGRVHVTPFRCSYL